MEQWEVDLLQTFRDGYRSSFTGSLVEWAESNVKIIGSGYANTGKFSCASSPHFKKIFEFIQDPAVRVLNILAPVRTGKTLCAEVALLYTIATSNGDILWLTVSDEKAEQLTERRIGSLIVNCEPVKRLLSDDKYNMQMRKYKFQHLTVDVTSPKDNALNMLGYKTIFADEAWDYERVYGREIINTIKLRTSDYKSLGKCNFLSQGGYTDEAWHRQFVYGEQWERGWRCPSCQKLQRFVFQGKRTDGSRFGIVFPDIRDEFGKHKIRECSKQAKLECFHCRHKVDDTLEARTALLMTGDEIKIADGETDEEKSIRLTPMCNPETTYGSLVRDFLKAKGDKDSLYRFITKQLAEFYDRSINKEKIIIKTSDYDPSNPFGEFEAKDEDGNPCRFMAVDCQQSEPFFYYGIAAVNTYGDIKAIKYGKCNTWDELNVIRMNNKVDYRFVGVDTGDGPRQEQIRAKCVAFGRWSDFDGDGFGETWNCYISLKGSGQDRFPTHSDGLNYRYKEPEQHAIVASTTQDEGKALTHVTWSNPRYKQILELLRDGKADRKLEFNEVTDELTEHMNSEIFQTNPKTKKWEYMKKPNAENHFWDVFNMLLVMMDLYDCLKVNNTIPEPEPETVEQLSGETNT